MVIGIAVAWSERLAAAFAWTVILPVCVLAVILPSQGEGFGYRYLHGSIGTAILLAVYGWRWLAARYGWLRPLFIRTTVAGMGVVLPLQAAMGHTYYALYAQIDGRIAASQADYFITGATDAPHLRELVNNRPDLSNHPLRLVGNEVDDGLIRNICRSGARVLLPKSALFRPIETYFFLKPLRSADERIASLSPRLTAAGCTVSYLDGP
jgi:hypothetical protein